MAKNNKTKLESLMNLVDDCNKRIKELDVEIYNNKKDLLINFLRYTRDQRRKKRKKSEILTSIRLEKLRLLRTYQSEIKELTTFEFEPFIDFLINILSVSEGETYRKEYLTLSRSIPLGDVYDFNLPVFKAYDSFVIIASNPDIEKVQNISGNVNTNMYTISQLLSGSKYIILGRKETYDIYDSNSNSFKSELVRAFPYLSEELKKVIDARVKFDVTDEVIFNAYVEGNTNNHVDEAELKKEDTKIKNMD